MVVRESGQRGIVPINRPRPAFPTLVKPADLTMVECRSPRIEFDATGEKAFDRLFVASKRMSSRDFQDKVMVRPGGVILVDRSICGQQFLHRTGFAQLAR